MGAGGESQEKRKQADKPAELRGTALTAPQKRREPAAEAPGDRRRTTRLVLLAALLHGLAYLFAVAPWMGEDEPWHLEYATHVAHLHRPWGGKPAMYGANVPIDERTLWATSQLQMRRRMAGVTEEELDARQREILQSMAEHDYYRRVDWAGAVQDRSDFDQIEPFFTASSQPAGYYVVLGLWLYPVRNASIDTQLAWARALSLLVYLATVWVALELARCAFSDRSLVIAATLAFAWFPMNARLGAVVNNDVLARALGAVVLMLCARRLSGDESRRTLALALGAVAFGLLVKSTVMSLAGVLYVTIALGATTPAKRRGLALVTVAGAALLAGVLWLWHTQHSPVLPRNLTAFLERLERGASPATFRELWHTFVGGFNWYSRELPERTYTVAAVVAGLAGLSAFTALFHTRRGVSRRVLALCFALIALQVGLVVLRGEGQGRYLMPAMAAIAIVFAAGLLAPLSGFRRPAGLRLFATLLFVYDAIFLWGGLVPNEYLVWGS